MTINQLDEKLSQLWAEAPVKYAFGNEQFAEMLKEFGISGMEEAKEKLVRITSGVYALKTDIPKISAILKQMKAVRHAAYQDRKFLMDKLMYEFANHECCITIDPYEAIESLGIEKGDYLYDALKEIAPKAWKKYLKSENLLAFYEPLDL